MVCNKPFSHPSSEFQGLMCVISKSTHVAETILTIHALLLKLKPWKPCTQTTESWRHFSVLKKNKKRRAAHCLQLKKKLPLNLIDSIKCFCCCHTNLSELLHLYEH